MPANRRSGMAVIQFLLRKRWVRVGNASSGVTSTTSMLFSLSRLANGEKNRNPGRGMAQLSAQCGAAITSDDGDRLAIGNAEIERDVKENPAFSGPGRGGGMGTPQSTARAELTASPSPRDTYLPRGSRSDFGARSRPTDPNWSLRCCTPPTSKEHRAPGQEPTGRT